MKMSDDPRLLLEVARLYFDKELNKKEIAGELNISNTQVARLLAEARKRGIVEIKYSPPRLEKLQVDLVNKFHCLRKSIVVPSIVPHDMKRQDTSTPDDDYLFQRRMWGEAAAAYFDENVTTDMKVGLSGGYTLYEMISALPKQERDIKIFPSAIIGRGPTIQHLDPLVLVTLLWARSERKPEANYVTILPFETGETREEVIERNKRLVSKNEKVRTVYEGMRQIDILFASVGSVEVSEEYKKYTHHTTIKLLEELGITQSDLTDNGIVGDFNYSFFNADGDPAPQWDVFIGLNVRDLREMAAHPKKKVVVIAGRHKAEALKAVLKGQLCNVLITDELTAQLLLKQ